MKGRCQIISGRAKGRVLRTPRGGATRPTGARVRQVLFDILAPALPGCGFLDAFAGSGAVGLEALSRGAARVVLVDDHPAALEATRANAAALGSLGGDVRVLRQDARLAVAVLGREGHRFDLVYLDPPYESGLYLPMLESVGGLLAPGGVVAVEHFHKHALPETIGGLAQTRQVRIGDHRLSFYRARPPAERAPEGS